MVLGDPGLFLNRAGADMGLEGRLNGPRLKKVLVGLAEWQLSSPWRINTITYNIRTTASQCRFLHFLKKIWDNALSSTYWEKCWLLRFQITEQWWKCLIIGFMPTKNASCQMPHLCLMSEWHSLTDQAYFLWLWHYADHWQHVWRTRTDRHGDTEWRDVITFRSFVSPWCFHRSVTWEFHTAKQPDKSHWKLFRQPKKQMASFCQEAFVKSERLTQWHKYLTVLYT